MDKEDYVIHAVARIQQIKKTLEEIESDEKEVYEAINAKLYKAESGFQQIKLDLYNEKAKIESNLVHIGAKEPSEEKKKEIIELSKQLYLKEKLQDLQSKEAFASRCWTNCVECITSCIECVTSCGLSGQSSGGCGLSSLVSSTCRPKPNIYDK